MCDGATFGPDDVVVTVVEYRFVRHEVRRHRGVIDEAYQQVVHDHAGDGWRLIQIFVEEPAAVAGSYVLIFERGGPAASVGRG